MDFSIGVILAGFLVSTVGFSLFLYGKKQARIPHLVAGGLMMFVPLAIQSALWISLTGIAATAGLWFAVREGH